MQEMRVGSLGPRQYEREHSPEGYPYEREHSPEGYPYEREHSPEGYPTATGARAAARSALLLARSRSGRAAGGGMRPRITHRIRHLVPFDCRVAHLPLAAQIWLDGDPRPAAIVGMVSHLPREPVARLVAFPLGTVGAVALLPAGAIERRGFLPGRRGRGRRAAGRHCCRTPRCGDGLAGRMSDLGGSRDRLRAAFQLFDQRRLLIPALLVERALLEGKEDTPFSHVVHGAKWDVVALPQPKRAEQAGLDLDEPFHGPGRSPGGTWPCLPAIDARDGADLLARAVKDVHPRH